MTTTFEIGLREALEVGVVVALVATTMPRPWTPRSRERFVAALATATVGSVVVAVAIYASAGALSDEIIGAIEVVMALLAAAMLTATAFWAARRANTTDRERPDLSMATVIAIASLAIMRETVEATWFLLATDADHLVLHPTFGLLLGVAVGVAASVLVLGALVAWTTPRTFSLVSQAMLVLIAGGMLTSAVRSMNRANWSELGAQPLVELDVLTSSWAILLRFAGGLIGVRPALSAAECIAWLAYATVVGVIAWRWYAVTLRLRARSLR